MCHHILSSRIMQDHGIVLSTLLPDLNAEGVVSTQLNLIFCQQFGLPKMLELRGSCIFIIPIEFLCHQARFFRPKVFDIVYITPLIENSLPNRN